MCVGLVWFECGVCVGCICWCVLVCVEFVVVWWC